MKVIEVVRLLGIMVDMVWFYICINILNFIKSKVNGYWEYSDNDVKCLRFVLSV